MCLGSTAWQWFQRSFGENSKGQEKLQEKVIQHSEPFIDSKYILNTFYGQGAVWEFMETTMKIQPICPVLTEPSLQMQQVRVTVPLQGRAGQQERMVLDHLPLIRTARPSCVHGDVPGSCRVHAGPGSHSSLSELKLQLESASPCILSWPYENLWVKNLHPKE